MKARVAVIGGGQNCEHEVSLASAAAVAAALAQAGYQVVRLTIGADGTWHDGGVRRPGLAGVVRILSGCDAVIPVLHGPHGEDGTLAALCDLAGITCVGSGLRAGALAMDKHVTKLIAADRRAGGPAHRCDSRRLPVDPSRRDQARGRRVEPRCHPRRGASRAV